MISSCGLDYLDVDVHFVNMGDIPTFDVEKLRRELTTKTPETEDVQILLKQLQWLLGSQVETLAKFGEIYHVMFKVLVDSGGQWSVAASSCDYYFDEYDGHYWYLNSSSREDQVTYQVYFGEEKELGVSFDRGTYQVSGNLTAGTYCWGTKFFSKQGVDFRDVLVGSGFMSHEDLLFFQVEETSWEL